MSEYVVLEQEMKDMADTITKYLPRITVCLEEIAKSSKLKWSEQEILRLAEEEHSNFDEAKEPKEYKEGE